MSEAQAQMLMKALFDVLVSAGVLDPKSSPNAIELIAAAEEYVRHES